MIQATLFANTTVESYFSELCSFFGVVSQPGWPNRFGRSLHAWVSETIERPIRTLSLFSGMGGLDIAFHDAGFQILELVELEPKFTATLRKNSGPGSYLGKCKVHCTDIREYVPAADAHFDFIIGGPPCQTFSAAARRASGVTGVNEDRGVLFKEYVRLLQLIQPKGFLFENVYGITGANQGRAWEEIQGAFSNAGYRVFWRILDAADYGVPQHRERMFIVGVQDGEVLFPLPTHGPDSCGGTAFYSAGEAVDGVILSDKERKANVRGRYEGYLEQIPPGLNYSFFTQELGHPNPMFAWRSKFSDFLYKADPACPVRTVKAQGGQYTGPFHWDNRPFSVDELKRLQTVPDRYELVGKRQVAVQQIGNSVPPQLARMLALAVLDQVFGVSPPVPMAYLECSQSLGFRKRKRQLTSRYRSKAKTAIESLQPGEMRDQSRLKAYKTQRSLSDRFDWKEATDNGSIQVRVNPERDLWGIQVWQGERVPDSWAFTITLTPRTLPSWHLPVPSVELTGGAYDPTLFTSLWKAFEEVLIRWKFKADLVQLCNYYHDDPSFTARFVPLLPFPKSEWEVVRLVCEGVGVRATLPTADLAGLWEVPERRVLPLALFLRKLGYEVRNSNTNAEIPQGCYLIPYAFPTLAPKSVQLNKSLV